MIINTIISHLFFEVYFEIGFSDYEKIYPLYLNSLLL